MLKLNTMLTKRDFTRTKGTMGDGLGSVKAEWESNKHIVQRYTNRDRTCVEFLSKESGLVDTFTLPYEEETIKFYIRDRL